MIDPLSKEEFTPKRTNQRFASAENRKIYHNQIARKKREVTRSIDYSIKKNWNILTLQLGGRDEVTRSKEFLLGAGFNFNFYQRAFATDFGTVQAIYDCGILIKDEKVLIQKLD